MSSKEFTKIGKTIEESREYHKQYLRAISNPLRRKILRAIKEGCSTFEDLQSSTRLNIKTLDWHLNILERGFCIEKYDKGGKIVYKLTQEGKVIDYLE